MGNWKTVTLGEITSFMAKGIPPKYVEHESNDTIRVLNQKCNRNYRISYSESRLHNNAVKKAPDAKMLRPGDVLINSTGAGTAGRVAQIWDIPTATTIDGHMILLRPTDEVDPLYYGYAVKGNQALIESYAEGSTGQTEINKDRLKSETIISFPEDKDQQRSIARTLAALDEKVEENERINKNLFQQAQLLFQQTLSVSENIVEVELGSIADVKGGKRLPKGINLVTMPNNHPYIRVRDLNDVVFATLTADYEYVDDETQKSISRYIVAPDDVLISIVGTIGLTAIVDKSLSNANLTENCVKVTHLKDITSEYLLLYLRSLSGQEKIRQGTVGAVQQKLPIKNIQAIKVPVLRGNAYKELTDSLSALFVMISANVTENKNLSQLRDLLLPKLISGELDVSTIDI